MCLPQYHNEFPSLLLRHCLRYAAALDIPFVDLDYGAEEWFQRARGMEFSPERGDRCTMCFDMRFERTALCVLFRRTL